MAEVGSTFVLAPGEEGPDFDLKDGKGDSFSLKDVMGDKGTLVMFVCNHCPFVVHLAKEVGVMAGEMKDWGVSAVAINSNEESGWDFPYLYDEDQSVARSYSAACTPDFFLLDGKGTLFYAGQFDDSRPGNGGVVDGKDLKLAIRDLLEGGSPVTATKPATGCNIKWKAGNEPEYFG